MAIYGGDGAILHASALAPAPFACTLKKVLLTGQRSPHKFRDLICQEPFAMN
jgi:hypothetical protein